MPLIDYMGQYIASDVTCSACGWTGKGAETKSGDSFGEGVEKHCPKCFHYFGFKQYSVVVVDDPPADWKAKIGRVED